MTKEFTADRAKEPPLTVGGLIAILEKQPREMLLIETRYSDYQFMKASEWSVIEAIVCPEWLMRVHPSMTPEQLNTAQKYFHIEGN